MYPWRSIIQIKKNSALPVYLQVANAVITEIHEGRLSPGQKLPGARLLSELLKLNRKTVVAAMEELHSQGWVESLPQKGTFVSEKLPQTEYKSLDNNGLSNQASGLGETNDLTFLEPLYLELKNKFRIDDGVPDVRLSPVSSLFKYHRSLLSRKSFNNLLMYNHVEGDLDLRTTLSTYLRSTRGIVTTPENLFITRGSQMGIYLAIAALLKVGESCVTSFPGYSIVDNMVQQLGGKVEHASVDSEGLIIADVEKICKRKQIKLLYITPHHHYPTTVTLSPVRRIELLQLAIKYNFFILEDDYAYDFHYSNNPVLPLASLNKSGQVIYIGSFSKILSPSVRIGYFIASNEVMVAANKLRRMIDRQGDPLLERALSEFIKAGDLQRHLKKIVKINQQRRDYFCNLVQTQLGDFVNFSIPEGGMSVWIKFRSKVKLKNIVKALFGKGYLMDTDDQFVNHFNAVRIGFASLTESEMDKFVKTLKKMLSQ